MQPLHHHFQRLNSALSRRVSPLGVLLALSLAALPLIALCAFLIVRCDGTETGIACTLNGGELRYRTVERNFERALVYYCQARGGRYTCPGRCLPGDVRFCDTKSVTDGRSACTDSSQCSYICWSTSDACEAGCLGQCGAYPVRACERYTELVKGEPKTHVAQESCLID